MEEFNDNVMVALLPINREWSRIALPHLTLVYVGLIKDLKPTTYNQLAKDVASIAMLSGPITLDVLGRDRFGKDEEEVDVLTLRASPELLSMRNMVEEWNASEWPFAPHVTIGPPGTSIDYIPGMIAFDRIMVAWGNEHINFWLRQRG